MGTYMVIIILTYYILYAPAEETGLCQISGPPPKRHLQFQSPGSAGSALFGGGVLRFAGFGSSQVRDAASGSQRRRPGEPGRCELRLFPAFILQSPRGLRPGGLGRADRQEAGSKGEAQAQHGDLRLCSERRIQDPSLRVTALLELIQE